MFFKTLLPVALAAGMSAGAAAAATLDFDGLSVGSYDSPGPSNQYFEDGFYYRLDGIDAVLEAGDIELRRTPGATAVFGSRTSFWGPTLLGGFEFSSIDWRGLSAGIAADISISGREFRTGLWYTDDFRATGTAAQTFVADNLAGQTIDQLWIVIDDGGVGPGAMDNLVLTPINVHPAPVPLPAAGGMLALALGLLARRRLT